MNIAPYLYDTPDEARRAFAAAFVTGDGLHSHHAVAQMVEDVEDTAEEVATLATYRGDRFQAATPPETWQQVIMEVALEYWRERRHA